MIHEIYEIVCRDCPLLYITIRRYDLDSEAQALLKGRYEECDRVGEIDLLCEYDGDCNAIRIIYELVLQGKLDLRDLREATS